MTQGTGIEFQAGDVLLRADYGDISAYHGGRYPAGTALGQKALELARSLLFPGGGRFVRGKCSVETPFAGKGFEDALEMVLRCTSLGRYTFDLDMPVPPGTVPAPVRGKFFYRFFQEDGRADLALKPGLVPEEFYKVSEDLYFKRVPPEAEEGAMELRRKIEAALLALDPTDIFDVREHKPCTVFPQDAPSEPPALKDDFRLRLKDYEEYQVGIEQLRRYHGNASLCGLCLAWSLVRQWARMEEGDEEGREALPREALPRRSVEVKSGALGDGISDAFEFLFRGTDGRVTVDTAWGDATPAPKVMPGSGAFAFRLALPGRPSRTFFLKEAVVPKDYLRLCRVKNENPGEFREEKERKSLQLEFASRVLADPEPFEVVEIVEKA
ncbi:MAG: hypothetical protein LBS00_05425 [Synergistaceae bacterium]|jgi:hypothetical protein|nr:hypothetical protein [Synergistaceae bacterium]